MIVINNPHDLHVALAGGKAASLLRLRQKDSRVPDFFVLCFESDEDIDANAGIAASAFNALGSELVAVRSSASVEDRRRTSFAGLFETRLNVTGHNLIRAIHYVYSSSTAPRVRSYCERQGIDCDSIRMAVIVQKQIPSVVDSR